MLIVAQSARQLASSAVRGGFRGLVCDCFGDRDVLAHGEIFPWRAFQPDEDDGLDRLLAALDRCVGKDRRVSLIYGSGVDSRPDWLERLATRCDVLGNSAETLRRVVTPSAFFHALDRCAVPYPETRFAAPETIAGWLRKPACGEGGKRVGFVAIPSAGQADSGCYFQKFHAGQPMSALFLASKSHRRILGFNTLWLSAHDPAQPFLFGGAINRVPLAATVKNEISGWIDRLVDELGLVGLNSLDFVWTGSGAYVLEVNPRPSATMALYDGDFPRGLVREHVLACRDEGNLPVSVEGPVRAFRIVYAAKPVIVPGAFDWPEWCADLPRGGRIEAGVPVCTVNAEGNIPALVEECLAARTATVFERLEQWASVV